MQNTSTLTALPDAPTLRTGRKLSKALFRELVEIGGDIDGKEFDPELAAYYNAFFKTNHYKGIAPRKLDGFYQFNYSPAGVYRQANWVAPCAALPPASGVAKSITKPTASDVTNRMVHWKYCMKAL